MKKPKECINSQCKNIIYVEDYQLELPLQCESCINDRIIPKDKYLYIRLKVQEGEREHIHHCLHITKCNNINFAGDWYAAHFWGESTRDNDTWYACNNEIAISLKEVKELSKKEFEFLDNLIY